VPIIQMTILIYDISPSKYNNQLTRNKTSLITKRNIWYNLPAFH
jgi:hypothetical protein